MLRINAPHGQTSYGRQLRLAMTFRSFLPPATDQTQQIDTDHSRYTQTDREADERDKDDTDMRIGEGACRDR
jgi:hypothetical protein